MIHICHLPEDVLRHIVKYLSSNTSVKSVNRDWYRFFNNKEYIKIQRPLIDSNVKLIREWLSGNLKGNYVIQIESIKQFLLRGYANPYHLKYTSFELASGIWINLDYFQTLLEKQHDGEYLKRRNHIVFFHN